MSSASARSPSRSAAIPALTGKLVHTTRAVGAVTEAMRKMKRGTVIGVRGPFGNSLAHGGGRGSDVVIVAGGIGLAPLRPALYHLIARSGELRPGRHALRGTHPRRLLFRRELETVARSLRPGRRRHGGPGHDSLARQRGRRHHAHSAGPRSTRANTIAMVCGPEVMMRFTVRELAEARRDAETASTSPWSGT